MAPTICSGKKRQTRTIASSSIRRHGHASHHLNHAFSNVVNFAAKGARVPTSLRIPTHNKTERNDNTTDNYRSANIETDLIYNFLIQSSAMPASSYQLQRNSFLSDNAVTSSAQSDTENSLDLRLANEILGIYAATTKTTSYNDNTTNTSISIPLSSPSSDTNSVSSYKEKISSPTLQRHERLFHRCSSIMQTHKLAEYTRVFSDSEEAELHNNGINNKLNSNKEITELNSLENGKHYASYNDPDSEDDDMEGVREFNGSLSVDYVDTDLETDEEDSVTILNTKKCAKSKRGNHPLLSDKLFAKHPAGNSSSNKNINNTKRRNNQPNTDGLLSIALKTIKLVERNQLLQQRLTQLQLETTEFIQSVLANPENRHFRENIKQKV